jgi:hypothetical protein
MAPAQSGPKKIDTIYIKRGVQHPNASTLSTPQDTQQQHQPSSQQHINIDQLLEGDPTTLVAAVFASQPQISSAPYQQ